MSPCPGALLSITHTQRVRARDGASKAHGTGAGTREPAAGGPRRPVPRRPQACPPRAHERPVPGTVTAPTSICCGETTVKILICSFSANYRLV